MHERSHAGLCRKNSLQGVVTATRGSRGKGRVSSRFHPQITVPRGHCSMASARNDFRALREMRWRSTFRVLWTAAYADKSAAPIPVTWTAASCVPSCLSLPSLAFP
jgi:hypothetical protein